MPSTLSTSFDRWPTMPSIAARSPGVSALTSGAAGALTVALGCPVGLLAAGAAGVPVDSSFCFSLQAPRTSAVAGRTDHHVRNDFMTGKPTGIHEAGAIPK